MSGADERLGFPHQFHLGILVEPLLLILIFSDGRFSDLTIPEFDLISRQQAADAVSVFTRSMRETVRDSSMSWLSMELRKPAAWRSYSARVPPDGRAPLSTRIIARSVIS